ncbi:MAG: PEP-CTERM sorting domain-containing protein [Bdellovibrionales bacterium]|nr:PEP-CTERM sorting domain-containing protein [Bdellovibrionales bacterium]
MHIRAHSTRAALLGLLVASLTTVQAEAETFYYFNDSLTQNPAAGSMNYIMSSYNDATQQLEFQVGFDASGPQTEGFWLALNGGGNPKGMAGELALLYFDASDASNLQLTAYGYNGQNGYTSYIDGDGNQAGNQAPDQILAHNSSWVSSISAGYDSEGQWTLGFSIDASAINAHSPLYPDPDGDPWKGAQFGNALGLWFHTVTGLATNYDPSGFLTAWNFSNSGWYDSSWERTSDVPEPGTLLLLGSGLFGVGAARRRRRREQEADAADAAA